jgi:surfeit locus 1 family protein
MGDAGSGPSERRSPWRRWLMVLALLAAALVFSALGTWQVQRLHWKTDLIARVEARLAAEPVPVPSPERWAGITAADEYMRVRLTGRFLHEKEAHVVASTERGPGYWVMTPLVLHDGSIVIVNRGFVTSDRRAPSTRAAGQAEGETTVVGLLRISEAESWILRANDPAADRWYRRDPVALGKARGLERVAPFFVDADAAPNPGGWPIGGLTRVRFTNNHLVYAITWFGLALLAALALGYVVRTEFGPPRPPRRADA